MYFVSNALLCAFEIKSRVHVIRKVIGNSYFLIFISKAFVLCFVSQEMVYVLSIPCTKVSLQPKGFFRNSLLTTISKSQISFNQRFFFSENPCLQPIKISIWGGEIYGSSCLSLSLSVYLSVCLSFYLYSSHCLSLCPSLSLSVSLSKVKYL